MLTGGTHYDENAQPPRGPDIIVLREIASAPLRYPFAGTAASVAVELEQKALRKLVDIQADRSEVVPRTRKRLRIGQLLVGLLLGSVVGLLLAVAVGIWLFRDPMPRLTAESLDRAVARWHAQGPDNYNLDLTLSGGQTGLIHVEVRDGEVTAMTRNGRTPEQRRTWDYWSVENQFDALSLELESALHPERAFGVTGENAVVLRAEFDPTYGFPRVYHRVVLGNSSELRWDVTSFVPVEMPAR